MSWIKTVPVAEAKGRLKMLYDRIKAPDGTVDHVMMIHSLRPHSMDGHMALYKNVLHHSSNKLDTWLLELIGVYVSMLNRCAYCVEHHFEGFRRILKDDDRAAAMRTALEADDISSLDAPVAAALRYAAALTQSPAAMTGADVDALRTAGYDDGEILEINQVAAYFAYANRSVLGLGVSLEESGIGRAPSDTDDPDNWSHQ